MTALASTMVEVIGQHNERQCMLYCVTDETTEVQSSGADGHLDI